MGLVEPCSALFRIGPGPRGIIFSFAHNWSRLGPFLKLGIVEAALLGTLAGAFLAGLDRLGGQVLLLSGAVLVGVFLAVYGQIYQTGADAWELFAGWAVLIFGFTLISRFAALGVLELALADTARVLYWQQVVCPNGWAEEDLLFVLLGGANGVALILREAGAPRGRVWLQGRWTRLLVWALVLCFLTLPVALWIVDSRGAGRVGWPGGPRSWLPWGGDTVTTAAAPPTWRRSLWGPPVFAR